MIHAIRTVMPKELRETLRDRRTLVNSLLIGPVLAPLFFILVLKLALARSVATQDELVPVTVANAAAAPNLVQQLRENGLDVSLREGTDADIRAWITAQNDLVVLRIPEAFGERFTAGRPAAVQLYSDGSDSEAGKHAGASPPSSPATPRGSRACACRRAASRRTSCSRSSIDDVDVSTPSARATLLLGMLSYVILLATLMGGLYLAIDATAGERERGSLESLLTLPVAAST